MVLLALTRKLNKALGPFLLRNGVKLRYALGGGVIRDSPMLDMATGIQFAQKLISIEVHDDATKLIEETQKTPSPLDVWVDETFDRLFGKDDMETKRKSMTPSELRVYVLESYLRPALLQDEQWNNVQTWRFHDRLLKWVRAEFLMAKYGLELQQALRDNPRLRKSPQLAVHPSMREGGILQTLVGSDDTDADTDNNKKQKIAASLPTKAAVENTFGIHQWCPQKDENNIILTKKLQQLASKLEGRVIPLRGGGLLVADIPATANLQSHSLETILELVGGHVMFCSTFNTLCEERDVYQLWTQEYVDRLARYLLKRTNNRGSGEETVILDIGAGDGLLAQHLQLAMGRELRLARTRNSSKGTTKPKSMQAPLIISVDDGSWRISPRASVEKLNVQEALAKYAGYVNDATTTGEQERKQQTTIVLCSWMPMGVDWSALFREHGVEEYILIGECDDGTCGANWETWGNPAYLSDDIVEQELMQALSEDQGEDLAASAKEPVTNTEPNDSDDSSVSPSYQIEGYKRIDKDDWAPFQFSRFDSSISKTGKTVVFRRVENNR